MLNINTVKEITAEAIKAQNEQNRLTAIDTIENILDPVIMCAAGNGKSSTIYNFAASAEDVVTLIAMMLMTAGYQIGTKRTSSRTIQMLISWED